MKKRIFFILSAVWLLAACSGLPPQTPDTAHLRAEAAPPAPATDIPPPVKTSAVLPAPAPTPRTEVYSVMVNKIDARELLFALARDAKVNVDISGKNKEISGQVTMNAIDQTLPQLLDRIAKQIDMRWELDGKNLFITVDEPYLHTYRIDYVNMSRDVTLSSTVTPQVSSGASGGAASTNTASTKIEDVSKNRFWETLDKNIKDILRETDKILPEGSSETVVERSEEQVGGTVAGEIAKMVKGGSKADAAASAAASAGNARQQGNATVRRSTVREAASVIINPESGIVTVRATSRQHEKIQEFLDAVIGSARRQVLIEATIVEVQLSRNYQQGIDWQILSTGGKGFNLTQASSSAGARSTLLNAGVGAQIPLKTNSTSANQGLLPSQSSSGTLPTQATASNLFTLGYNSANFASAIKLLESFGNVKVLSSPKVSVLNNQTAVINVGTQVVYFKVTCTLSPATTTAAATTACDTTPQTAAVGLLMSVTPQISGDGSVLINVRPSTSRIVSYAPDPNPQLTVTNSVPVIERRDMESILRVTDGETAVLGGLMQDSIDYKDDNVPGLASIPLIGNLFSYKNQTNTKTELVIFLRPTVIKDASVNGDFRRLRGNLPDKDFLKPNWGPSAAGVSESGAQ